MLIQTHHKQTDLATMKAEIENIKMHFATKAGIMRWTVAVGIATILTIIGFVNEFRKEIRTDMQEMRQEFRHDMRQMREEMRQMNENMQKNTALLSEKIDRLSRTP